MRRIVVLFVIAGLPGCASNIGALQRATAQSVGGNLSPDQVTITDVNRGALDVAWQATAQGRAYKCSGDDMMHNAYCVRQ